MVLADVEKIKYLGVTITNDLNGTHVSNIFTKANRTLGFLRRNLAAWRYRVSIQGTDTSSPRVWLAGCFGFNGPLRQYFSLYRAVSQREGERGERIDESKNVQTTPTRTYCKRNRPLPYCNQNCRTPRHWKFTQHHRTTRPPPTRVW